MLENKSVGELAKEFQLELRGNGAVVINGVASLEESRPGNLGFIRSSKYMKFIDTALASAIIVPEGVDLPQNSEKAYLLSKDPYVSFASILSAYYCPKPVLLGVSTQAFVDPTAKIHAEVTIEANVFIAAHVTIGRGSIVRSGVRIGEYSNLGENVLVGANVVIEDRSIIGHRVILNPGVVIGGDGFGYTQTEEGNVKLPQIGNVILEDDVEIGANSTVDRGSLGSTVIGRGTKIDNLVQIGHGTRIGPHNVICSQSGVAGSVQTGEKVILASRAGVGDHIKIGDKTTIGPMAGVTKDLPSGGVFSGFPAMPHNDWLKMIGTLAQLPALRDQFRNLFKK
jgi:UDP-3-O-[3-hydroxymyristoyl] glucosamine N-acyltransferase